MLDRDLDRAYAEAAADVFERSFQESLPPEFCEHQQRRAEFNSTLDRVRYLLLQLARERSRKRTGSRRR